MHLSRNLRQPMLIGLFASVATAGALAASSADPAPASSAPSSATVKIEDIDFKPARLTIRRGGTVRWTFRDVATSHNVRSKGRPRFPGSPTKETGSYRVTFKRAGTYRYVCTLHLNMKGTVVVR